VPHVVRNPTLDDALVTALVRLWALVTNAGGAVGFVPPVAVEDVRPVAEAAFARVRVGLDDLAVGYDRAEPVGFGFLVANDTPLHRHWSTIRRLQRHPDHRGRGIGGLLLAELEQAARDRKLRRVVLTIRGGTGREGFYLTHGYILDAVLPERLCVGHEVLDELVLSKALAPAATPRRLGAGTLVLPVRRLDAELPLPGYAHPGDAGLDLHAREDVTLAPGRRAVVPTGIAVAVPEGHVGLVHPRSGLAARHGLALVNAPGTVDAGYRGELKVVLVNLDPAEPVVLRRGERIAQLVVQRVETVSVAEVDELPASRRGDGGFGSTGR
jgi:dUTP pyrophosphatase